MENITLVKNTKLESIDGLRAISIIFVLISHFYFKNSFIEKTHIGIIGVHIFFVISGFLITTLLLREKLKNELISLKNFYIRRLFRIFPLVYLFIFVLFFLNIFFDLKITNISFLQSLFFVKNYPIPNSGLDWYSSHLWSLAVEEQFYLLFPFFISKLNIKQYKKLILVFIITIPIANFIILNSGEVGFLYTNKFTHILINGFFIVFNDGIKLILIGSLLSCIYFEDPNVFKKASILNAKYSTFLLFIMAVLFAVSTYHFFTIPYLPDIVFAFLIGIILIFNLDVNNFFAIFLNNKYLARLGVLSFSIYIWQQLFTLKQPWKDLFIYGDSKLLNLLALLTVSFISYHLYEKKFLKIRDKYKVLK